MNVIGFDDGPFARDHRGNVLLVGVVCSATRVDGIVSGKIRRDGVDATRRMVELVRASQFGEHVQAVMMQGIAVGGFNVVDINALSEALKIPVLVVVRKLPNMDAVKQALFSTSPTGIRHAVPGAAKKWKLIEKAGTLEPLGMSNRAQKRLKSPKATGLPAATPQKLWLQRAGLTLDEARQIIARTTLHGNIPEPLRLAHLIAGGITTGKSRGRA